jgi:hypothetical protein
MCVIPDGENYDIFHSVFIAELSLRKHGTLVLSFDDNIIPLKPNTPSGRAKGATQIKKYERATGV